MIEEFKEGVAWSGVAGRREARRGRTTAKRECGGCTACCTLVPVYEISKPANTKCKYQYFKGCRLYHDKTAMPMGCQLWSCRWLANDDTGDLPRPDRAHYVIDILPDFIRITNEDQTETEMPVIQIWIDPKHPDAWRTDEFRAYMDRRGAEGNAILIRNGNASAICIFPPSLQRLHGRPEHEIAWIERGSNMNATMRTEPQHKFIDILRVLSGEKVGQ